jgi:hypothetical protein
MVLGVRLAFATRRPWVYLVFLFTVLAVGIPAVCIAQSKSSSQQLESIRRRMETGLSMFVAGKAVEAAAEFDAGYAEHPYSAFLYNAGICYQKLNNADKALERYREYVKIDPSAPDIDAVQKRIAALEAAKAAATAATVPLADGGAPPPPPPPLEPVPTGEDAMRSLVVVETEPPGAPIRVYLAESEGTQAFKGGTPNVGWKEVVATTTPSSLSLAVGRYHVVIEKFRDFNLSETDIKVNAGHVHHFKANLSQGVFMSFLRVAANVAGAHVWLDDPKKAKPEWGTTPYGELVAAGEHQVLVEAPGFQPLTTKVVLVHGEQKELEVRMVRVDYGILRVDADSADAKIRVDEDPKGVWRSGEPPLEVQVPSGKHRLTIEGTDRKTYEGMIDVPRGQVLPIHAKLIPKFPRGGAWTQAILGGVFIGAGAFLGVESNKLYDQVKADREAGVLQEDDSRITRGRIYAISADCAFVAGGVLAALSTYNFVRDPMPESSSKLDKPVEFEDPLKARPTAAVTARPGARVAAAPAPKKKPEQNRPVLQAGPAAFEGGGGFVLGGSF